MSDSTNAADIALAKAIARRSIRRHNAQQAAKLNAAAIHVAELQNALNVARQTLSEQSAELTDAAEAVSLLQTRVVEVERERNDAREDASYHARTFNQLLNAMRGMRSDEFAHVTAALRARVQ